MLRMLLVSRVRAARSARWLAGFVILAAAWQHDGRTAAPCVMVHPEVGWTDESWTDGADFTPNGEVGIWSNAKGVIGYSVLEDSIVWSSGRCALFNRLYSDSTVMP